VCFYFKHLQMGAIHTESGELGVANFWW
jgi:hypothetical protein